MSMDFCFRFPLSPMPMPSDTFVSFLSPDVTVPRHEDGHTPTSTDKGSPVSTSSPIFQSQPSRIIPRGDSPNESPYVTRFVSLPDYLWVLSPQLFPDGLLHNGSGPFDVHSLEVTTLRGSLGNLFHSRNLYTV